MEASSAVSAFRETGVAWPRSDGRDRDLSRDFSVRDVKYSPDANMSACVHVSPAKCIFATLTHVPCNFHQLIELYYTNFLLNITLSGAAVQPMSLIMLY